MRLSPLIPKLPGTRKIIPGNKVIKDGRFLSLENKLLKIPIIKAAIKSERTSLKIWLRSLRLPKVNIPLKSTQI